MGELLFGWVGGLWWWVGDLGGKGGYGGSELLLSSARSVVQALGVGVVWGGRGKG